MLVGKKKEKELNKIQKETLKMFDEILKNFSLLKEAIIKKDKKIVVIVLENDINIDRMEEEITYDIQNFIIVNQPMAIDLRKILGTYSIISDLLRLGDYTCNIAKHLIKYDEIEANFQPEFLDIINMIEVQIIQAKITYKNIDHKLAKKTGLKDKEIDIKTKELIKNIVKAIKNSDEIEIDIEAGEINLIILVKILERAGDHIVNMCEQISYIARGKRYNYEY